MIRPFSLVRCRSSLFVLALVLALGAPLAAQRPDVPPAPAQSPAAANALVQLLPADTRGFVRIRAGEFWKRGVHQLLDRRPIDGELTAYDYLADEAAPLDPRDIEELVVASLVTKRMPESARQLAPDESAPPANGPWEVTVALVQTNKPVDAAQHLRKLQEKLNAAPVFGLEGELDMTLRAKQESDRTYYANATLGTAFLSETRFLTGEPEAVQLVLAALAKGQTLPKRLLETAQRRDALIGGAYRADKDLDAIGVEGLESLADVTFAITFGKQIELDASLSFTKAPNLGTLAALAQWILSDGFSVEEYQEDLKREMVQAAEPLEVLPEVASKLAAGELNLKDGAIQYHLVMPLNLERATLAGCEAFGVVFAQLGDALSGLDFSDLFGGGSAPRTDLAEELVRIKTGLEAYRAKHGRYPAPAIYAQDGTPLLSWRVALLPYLGERELYERFRLNEPWNSDHNLKVVSDHAEDNLYLAGEGRTTPFRLFTGKDAPFADRQGPAAAEFKDGISKTALVVEATRQVIWTRPESLRLIEGHPLPMLGRAISDEQAPPPEQIPAGLEPRQFYALLADGTIRLIKLKPDAAGEARLRPLFTSTGGEPFSPPGAKIDAALKPRSKAFVPPAPNDAPPPPAPVP